MSDKIKLSKAQVELLKEKKGSFVNYYRPGLKLIELGLIDVTGTSYYHWKINDAGEKALAAHATE